MERYCIAFSSKPDEWEEEIVKCVTQLPFECVNILGQGENCSIHSICPLEEEEEEYKEEEEEEEEEENPYDADWDHKYFGLDDTIKTIDNDEDSFDDEGSMSASNDDEEWSSVQKDGSTRPTSQAHKCVTTLSPMGMVEVVAKKFGRLGDMCYEGFDPKTNTTTVHSGETYMDWLVSQENPIQTKDIDQRITLNSACFSEFVSESLCHILLTDLVAKQVTPHVVMAFRALECENKGYLLQERINSTIQEFLEENPRVDARGVASLYLQTFVTLHVLQNTCGFKHSDLHVNNLFIKEIDEHMEWKGVKLETASHFSYNLGDGVVLTVPNIGYLVKIGDFGYSSLDAFGRRIQRLDKNAARPNEPRWGDQTIKLTHAGHDGQLLLGSPPFTQDSWRAKDAQTQEVLTRLRKSAQGPNGKVTWATARPAIGHVSDVAPLDVVKQVFVHSPPQCADFTQTPEGATVVCLTNMADLSTTHPRKAPKRRRRTRISTEV
jgi:hypothetical protein